MGGAPDAALYGLAHGHSPDRGFHREILYLHGGRERAYDLARGARGDLCRGLGLLLLARHYGDVHAGAGRGQRQPGPGCPDRSITRDNRGPGDRSSGGCSARTLPQPYRKSGSERHLAAAVRLGIASFHGKNWKRIPWDSKKATSSMNINGFRRVADWS